MWIAYLQQQDAVCWLDSKQTTEGTEMRYIIVWLQRRYLLVLVLVVLVFEGDLSTIMKI